MMVEHRPVLTFVTHATLILGALVLAFPIYVTFVASTHTLEVVSKSFPTPSREPPGGELPASGCGLSSSG